MSQSIDTKIVELKFNNDNFADKVNSTLTQLEKLNEEIKEVGVKDAFKNLAKGVKDVDISNVSKGVEEASKGFSKLEVAGLTALVNISNAAVNLGKKLVSNLISPLTKGVMQGGLSRARNIEQATFSFEGQKIGKSKGNEGLSYYKEVMDAVLGTSYSYDVAAKAASQLAASNIGVEKSMRKLADGTEIEAKILNKDMTKALLGIAGVASMTGRSFDDVSRVFTKIAGNNRVYAQDLQSFSAMGLNAAAVLASAMGTTEEKIYEMVKAGEIHFKEFSAAMNEAFGQHAKDSTLMFQGALDDVNAALARIGADFYGPALNAGRDVLNSITPVIDAIHTKLNPALTTTNGIMDRASKSLSQYLDMFAYLIEMYPHMDRTKMSGWITEHMNSWTNIADLYKRGDISKAIQGLQEYSKTFKGMQDKPGIDAYKMIGDYLSVGTNGDLLSRYLDKTDKDIQKITKTGKIGAKDLKTVIDGMVKDGTIGFNTMYKAFHKLWSESDDLMGIASINKEFNNYLRSVIKAEEPSERFNKHLKTFAAIVNGGLSLFRSFTTILGGFADIFLTIAQHLRPLGKLFVNVTEEAAKFVVKVADYLATSESFNTIIDGITSLIVKLFSFIDVGKLCTFILASIQKGFEFLNIAINKVYTGIATVVGTVSKILQTIADKVHSIITSSEELSKVIQALKGAGIIVMVSRIALALTRPAEILETITAASTSALIAIKDVTSKISYFFYNLGQISKNVNAFVYELTTTLKRMQELIIATAILEIAFAIGVLAAAIYFLSKVNAEGANNTLIATMEVLAIMATMGALFAQVKKKVVTKVKVWEKTAEGVKDVAKAFMIMALSVLIIAAAIRILSKIKTEDMLTAFAVVEVLMITMAGIAKMLTTSYTFTINKSGLNRSASGITKGLYQLIAMALAVKIVAKAIVDIANQTDTDALWNAVGVVELIMWSIAAIIKWLSSDTTTKMAKGAMTLLAMALAIRMLVKPIIELSALAGSNNDALWSAVAAIGGLMAAMGLLMKMMSGSKGLIKAGAALILVAYAIRMLSDVVSVFSQMNAESMWQGLVGLGAALYGIVGALALINPKGVLAKVAAIYIIVKAMEDLSAIIMEFGYNNEAAWAGIGVAVIALTGLAGACWLFKKVPTSGILKLFATLSLGALVVVEFGVAIGIFGIGLTAFSMGLGVLADSAKKAQEVGGTIVGIMSGFAIAIAILSSVGLPAVGVILALAGAFILFGIGMQKVGSGMNDLAVAVKILSEMKGELGETAKNITDFVDDLKKLKKQSSEIGESFKSIAEPLKEIKDAAGTISEQIDKLVKSYTDLVEKSSNCITQLSDSLTSISKLNEDSFGKASLAVKEFISDLAGISEDSDKVATISSNISGSLEGVKLTFEDVVQAIGNFKSLSYDTFNELADSLDAIANPIKVLNDLRGKFEEIASDLREFISSLASMKANASVVSEGATAIAESLTEVGDAANIAKNGFEGLTKKTSDILIDMGKGLEAIGNGIKIIAEQKDSLDSASSSIESFYKRLESINGLAETIAGGTKAVAGAVKALGSAAEKTASLSKSGMSDSGGKMVDGLISGMTNKKTEMNTKVTAMVDSVAKTVKAKRKGWYDIGSYLIAGMISGIASQQAELERQVKKLEDAAERAVKAKAKSHSPSRVWMVIGSYLGEGLAIGIKNSGDEVKRASIALASTSEDAIQSAITSITDAMNDNFEMNPKITPVVDLTNIRNSAVFANSAFNSSLLGVRGNGLAASITHTIQNGGKSNIEKSIDDLTDQIGTMTETMNSRSLNNYINIDGASDPEAFADGLIRSFRLNARTV